jgi:alpha-galactosidase
MERRRRLPLLREAVKDPKNYGERTGAYRTVPAIRMVRHGIERSRSEYVPYYRKNAEMIENDLRPKFQNPHDEWLTWSVGGYLRHCKMRLHDLYG